jgi:hypothetical protein
LRPDWKWIGNKSRATRLGFSLLLKFYEIEGKPLSGCEAGTIIYGFTPVR